MLDRALEDAKAQGQRLVVLVGDEAYYSRVGFRAIPKGRADMPGPVDHRRLLVRELVDGAFCIRYFQPFLFKGHFRNDALIVQAFLPFEEEGGTS